MIWQRLYGFANVTDNSSIKRCSTYRAGSSQESTGQTYIVKASLIVAFQQTRRETQRFFDKNKECRGCRENISSDVCSIEY